MREALGLDYFEGRSWRGFHHACLVMLGFGFLALEGIPKPAPGRPGSASARRGEGAGGVSTPPA